LDDVVGIVQAKICWRASAGKNVALKASMQPPPFVPRTMTALQVLEHIKISSSQIVLVVDEYGGIEGCSPITTYSKRLPAICRWQNASGPKAVQRKDGSWLLDGMLSVDEFKDIFKLETLPRKEGHVSNLGRLYLHPDGTRSISVRAL
jgi:putative hemolysin